MAAHRGEICKKNRVCRCRKCCGSCVCHKSLSTEIGDLEPMPKSDPLQASSNDSMLWMFLRGLWYVVVGIFKVIWCLIEIALAFWAISSLMDWIGGRRDR